MSKLQINIAEQITSGFVSIDSLDEFKKILQQFPDDPNLQKAYSGFLVDNDLPIVAVTSYGKAAELYLKDGQLLQAMVSKALQWKINSPSYREALLFFSALREARHRDSPVNKFINKLSNPEIWALMKNAEIVHLPSGHVQKKVDDQESDLYFVASGSLKKTCYKPLREGETTMYNKQHFYLFENDFFGDVYPLQEEKTSQSYIETVTAVELVKISKQILSEICKKYSNVESALAVLFDSQSDSIKIKSLPEIRQGERHQIVIKMTLEIYPQASVNFPIILNGYSRNISVGGTCIVLEAKDIHVSNSVASFHKIIDDAKIKMSFKNEGLELKVSGKIIWTHEVLYEGEKTLALGVHFEDLSPKLRGMLFVFAENS